MSNSLPEISEEELQERVLYSVLRAAAVLARLFRFPLKKVVSWLEVAYYHELRDHGFTQKDAAEFFGVSTRKVVQLAGRLKRNFFRPEQESELPRRIEFMLWAGPLSEGRIKQGLRDVPDEEIDEALDQLVTRERVHRSDGRTTYYEVPSSEFRLFEDDWIARIDGLNNHLENVIDGVFARFFRDDERALARTLNFRMKREDVEKLEELYEDVVFPTLAELEKQSEDADEDETLEMSLSMNWAPYRYSNNEE